MAVDYSLNFSGAKLGSTGGTPTQTSTAPAGSASAGYAGGAMAAGGFLLTYAESEMQKAAAISQSANYLVAARDTLAVAQVRADLSDTYAWVQAGRTMQKSQQEALNWQIAGNTLLKNLRTTNAAARARAAASGVSLDSGSIVGAQTQNTHAVMQDVAITDLNALTARVMGFEDATAMVQSTEYQNFLNTFTAERQAGQYTSAAATTASSGGMLSNYTLARGVYNLAKA